MDDERISEEGDSDYEDTRIECLNNEDPRKGENNENQKVTLEQGEPAINRKVGRPKNITEEATIVNRYLRKQEEEKLDEQRDVRRSTIRNQNIMRSVDRKIPTTITETKQSPE